MRILYVTAAMPYGKAETFIISEIEELLCRNEVLVAPRSPKRLGRHADWLAPYTIREHLLSPIVLLRAVLAFARRPRASLRTLKILFGSPRPRTVLGNLAVFPKGLWLAGVARRWRADHIHCHWAGTTATMAMIASRLSGVPWSLTTHRSDIVSDNLLKEKTRSAAFVRAIASEGRKMLMERNAEPESKLLVLPMGVRIPPLDPALAGPKEKVVLCPADLLPVKGHRFLISAWRTLLDRGYSAKLLLAGSGELKAVLHSQVAQLGIADTVEFLGTIEHKSLLDYYRRREVAAVVLASVDLGAGVHEGIPVALVEAMSYGVPVIATTTGGIPELVIPGTGLLVPPADPLALADALGQVLGNPSHAGAMAECGRRWVASSRNIVEVAAQLENLFAGIRPPHYRGPGEIPAVLRRTSEQASLETNSIARA